MESNLLGALRAFIMIIFVFLPGGCTDKEKSPQDNQVWDVDKVPPPKFINKNYIEMDKIYCISKFRSAVGHDYSDAFEHCRSMKHYFQPLPGTDWAAIKIYSPISGTIKRIEQEWSGTKIEIESGKYPAFRVTVFHINPIKQWSLEEKVTVGTQLGTHIGMGTYSDISVIANDPTKQGRMVSYFEVITDEVFNEFSSYGITSRDSLIISREERDNHPLSCNGDVFAEPDMPTDWVYLKH